MFRKVPELTKQAQPLTLISKERFFQKKWFLFALSFLLPAIIQGVVFFVVMGYPINGGLSFRDDIAAQYYPFISDYLSRLKEGRSLLWSWTVGGGVDYISLFSYYLTSPLNLLLLFLPHSWLANAFLFLILIKIGFAGLFMSVYLSSVHEKKDLSLPVFASFYALCSFALCYYWVIIWLDTFALMPLVMLGFMSFMREGKFKLYIISLAAALFTNFYIGFYICVFVVISFIGQCVILKLNRREILRKFFQIAAYSLIAVCLTAVTLLPAYSGANTEGLPPVGIHPYYRFYEVFGNFIAFMWPTSPLTLANFYCGMFCVMLAGVFLGTAKIPLREKVVFAVTLCFYIITTNVNVLYYTMNAFRYPNGLHQRYTFIISFMLISAAYRAFILIKDDCKLRDLLSMGIIAAGIICLASLGLQAVFTLPNAALCGAYIVLFALLAFSENAHAKVRMFIKPLTGAAFLGLILTELGVTSVAYINEFMIFRGEIPIKYAEAQTLLNMRVQGEAFYRTELIDQSLYYHGRNYSAMYGYEGISHYSSTADIELSAFLGALGLRSDKLSYGYVETSPVTNLFLNIRYLASLDGPPADDGVYWEKTGESDGLLIENKYYLPLGFMVNREMADFAKDGLSPETGDFLNQNTLFRLASGTEGELFTKLVPKAQKYEDGFLTYEYEMPRDDMLYAYISSEEIVVDISANGEALRRINRASDTAPAFIAAAGFFRKGDTVLFSTNLPDYMADNSLSFVSAGVIAHEIFKEGYEKLADETLHLTEFTDTYVKGGITVLEDGVLYTSIPFKSWKAYVDGAQVEVIPIGGAMLGLYLEEGEYQIEFRYYNSALTAGAVLSLAAFVCLIVTRKHQV